MRSQCSYKVSHPCSQLTKKQKLSSFCPLPLYKTLLTNVSLITYSPLYAPSYFSCYMFSKPEAMAELELDWTNWILGPDRTSMYLSWEIHNSYWTLCIFYIPKESCGNFRYMIINDYSPPLFVTYYFNLFFI